VDSTPKEIEVFFLDAGKDTGPFGGTLWLFFEAAELGKN